MLKKKLVTIVAAAFCVALVTAQSSAVNEVTTGLIGDGAIDSFKFGTEDGSGVIFGQYNNADKSVVLGWGNSLSDTLWLSVYDAWNFVYNLNAIETATAINNASAEDKINVDYTTTTRKVEGHNYNQIVNTLGIGAGINNTLGFQLVWDADYLVYKNPVLGAVIKEEVNEPGNGRNTKNEWTKCANNEIKNDFTVNFKGVGIENLGDIAFFAKLNKVYFKWNSRNRTGDYTQSETINGKTTSETTITVKNTINTLTPGLNFDLGLNVIDNDIANVKFVYEDEFKMSFKPSTNESTQTVKKPIATASTETTQTISNKIEYGKYLYWSNKFEPKLAAEFSVAKPLKLKAQLALPVTLTQTIDDADKYETVSQTETFNRTNGYSELNKTTTTGRYDPYGYTVQNSDIFTTSFAPKLSVGFVYEVTPGKFNVNFGVSAQPTYTWTTTTSTNANINTVEVTEKKDDRGNVTTLNPVVTAGVNNGDPETKTTVLSTPTSCPTEINIGATWFFTENVKFDAYILNSFGNDLFNLTRAGASVTVKF